MVFNSIDFIIFFPIVLLLYFGAPRKCRYLVLLISSYYFYMSWNPKYALLIAASTIITYISGLLMQKYYSKKTIFLIINCVINLCILFVFKYANFLIDCINELLRMIGLNVIHRRLDVLLPVGISFYTFQALSYTFDIYKGKIRPERNILKYALYVSFFPQLVAGPIERSTKLLPQIQNVNKINIWDYSRIRNGFLLMMYGYFQKLVIADRASILVDNVINNYSSYGFKEIVIALILFAFQIYCDFGGYTNIARGAALIMGFELTHNFRQPYFATSIKDFWRRWHISLTSWFTEYLYIPLGGNRKGIYKKYYNIFVVFAVSGLWHGADWSFCVWGILHAFYQIIEDLVYSRGIFSNEHRSISIKIRKTIATFILVDFAWIFFVSQNLEKSIGLIKQMFSRYSTTSVYLLGLDKENLIILCFALLVLFVVDFIHEKGISIFEAMEKQEVWFRYGLDLSLTWITLLFGVYGPSYDASSFIYFQF